MLVFDWPGYFFCAQRKGTSPGNAILCLLDSVAATRLHWRHEQPSPAAAAAQRRVEGRRVEDAGAGRLAHARVGVRVRYVARGALLREELAAHVSPLPRRRLAAREARLAPRALGCARGAQRGRRTARPGSSAAPSVIRRHGCSSRRTRASTLRATVRTRVCAHAAAIASGRAGARVYVCLCHSRATGSSCLTNPRDMLSKGHFFLFVDIT